MPPLPQELTDIIIHYLQLPADYNSLLACSLVCRAFLPAALSKLHFAVYIEKHNVQRASEHLTLNVAQYVRELHFHSSHGDSGWLSGEPVVVILRQLFQLQKMRLHCCTWSALSSDLRTEIIRIFQGQCFHHVQIFGVEGIPITLFESFTNLRHLELSSISLETPSESSQLVPSIIPNGPSPMGTIMPHTKPAKSPVYLESLGLAVLSGELPSVSIGVQNKDIITVLDFLLSPGTPLNMTRLGTVSFDTDPLNREFERSLGRLLGACSTTITRVKMTSPVYTDSDPFLSTPISFKKLRCLKYLVILISHIQNSAMRWLAHVLATFGPWSHIANIQIVFILHDDCHLVADDEWNSLDTALMLPSFVTLSRLVIEWSVFPGALTLDEEHGLLFGILAKSKLPLVNGRNLLEVRKMRSLHNDLFSLDFN